MNPMFIILAAGMGTRLGKSLPKALTVLDGGETIMERQIRNIHAAFGKKAKIMIVVGYKLDHIIEAFPDEDFVYNEAYDTTNTSKSLLRGLKALPKNSGVVWMNGDVVFDDRLLANLRVAIEADDQSTIVVNSESVSDEEVKYTVDARGNINLLSKQVPSKLALGEAVGINFVSASDRPSLEENLRIVDANDYFEKAIELSITKNRVEYLPFDLTLLGLHATEVDFGEDLQKANETIIRYGQNRLIV